jgi:hypothetical protein
VKAAPMMMPTAMSMTLPRLMKVLNSWNMSSSPLLDGRLAIASLSPSDLKPMVRQTQSQP